jgi:transcriptional antiterminator RfaH
MDEKNWYVVNTQSGKEEIAATRLRFFNLATLCPKILTVQSNGYGKKYERVRPLFPGYFFARCGLEQYGLAALGMRKEVLRFVNFGLGPAVVSDFLIEEIKSRVGADGYVKLDDGPPARTYASCGLEPDQRVLVTDGVWAGHTGIFKRELGSAERLVVLMHILGSEREVQFPLRSVESLAFSGHDVEV